MHVSYYPGHFQDADILLKALGISGLPGTEKPAKEGGTLSMMHLRDTATGLIKKHYVRKVSSVVHRQWTTDFFSNIVVFDIIY